MNLPSDSIAIIGAIALLLIISALFFLFRAKDFHYKTVALFSPAEKFFFFALERAVGQKYRVFAKVRIADVIHPSKELSKKKWWQHFVQISSKHFDYVLCDKRTLEVLCVVELNDRSHERKDRSKRDGLVLEVCASANLPLVWIRARKHYDDSVVSEKIQKTILETRKRK